MPEDFYLSQDLRAHSFLADVPLHDAWYVHLPDSLEGRTLLDVDESMTRAGVGGITVALAATIATYGLAAKGLGLAKPECVDPRASIRHRLPEADRAGTVNAPGTAGFVYHFEREALLEIRTCAAHALQVFALIPETGGYGFYIGVYSKRVSRLTPYYMRLIDPVRRLVVYPSLLQRFEQSWRVNLRAEATSARVPESP